MHRPQMYRLVALLVGGAALFTSAGCGAAKSDVSGTVSYMGKSLAMGQVLIVASDSNPYYGDITEDGTYRITGVPTGEAKVAVSSANPALVGKGRGGEIAERLKKVGEKPAAPVVDPKKWFAIPEKYETHTTSGLTMSVTGGTTTHNISLKD